ncbi:hypothetical protein MKK63_14245 [Methylobacterium sp. J-088]|uniref:hypothetical protein n=1 Tax=Methylobacterium sp. J-088 TaxID=2836664 RepID=UPI001FB89FF5|nr:hypothetical protein [Methylobacterium sp. J-088]MCJ2063864.1 hypothetical protein [Methylobacterium sp. J-088]
MPRVEITGTERQYKTVAAVEDEGTWRLFRPFRDGKIISAVCFGDDRLACFSEGGELALIDWRANREILRRKLSVKSTSLYRLFVTADTELIALYQRARQPDGQHYVFHLQLLRVQDLQMVAEGEGLRWSGDHSVARLVMGYVYPPTDDDPKYLTICSDLFEDPAGRLSFIGFDCHPTGLHYGVFHLDRSDWTVRYEPLTDETKPWWLSPGRRYLATLSRGLPVIREGSADTPAAHRDANGAGRVEQALDVWTTVPLQRIAAGIASERHLKISQIVWEPDETAFWIRFGYSWDTQAEFQRAALDGTLSPVFSFQRFDGKKLVIEIADVTRADHVVISAFPDTVTIPRAWCASTAANRVISEDEDGFQAGGLTGPSGMAVQRFLSKTSRRPVVPVASFSQADIAAALEQLAQEIRTRLVALMQGEYLKLSFVVAGRKMTETAFFARVSRERIPVASALRALLTTYLEVQPAAVEAKRLFRQIWGPKADQGALAAAMEALLRLDPESHDVFRDYLAKRDGEHETYSTDVMVKAYLAETGWRDAAMLGFGIYVALIQYRDGLIWLGGGFLANHGLLDAAETLLSADAFADLMLQELDRFVAIPDIDCRFSRDELYGQLLSGLEGTPFGARVIDALAARRPLPAPSQG